MRSTPEVRRQVAAVLIALGVSGIAAAQHVDAGPECAEPVPVYKSPPAYWMCRPQIRPATERNDASADAVDEAIARIGRNARRQCAQWAEKAFEEFERITFKEPFENGKYIVSGDIPIPDREQLREFFDTQIRQDAQESDPGALVVHRVRGRNAIWSDTLKKQLTYCVSSRFGNRHRRVVADMEAATGAWESAANVDFIHLAAEDAACTADNMNVLFDVRPVDVNGEYLARAFFPNDRRAERNLLVDESAFQLHPDGALQLVGILRHEIGHILGWRHEHTRPESGACFEDNDWKPLTDYDRFSVMHYPQCNGGGDWSLTLTHMDRNGAACVYGPAPQFTIDPKICPDPHKPAAARKPDPRISML